MVKDYLAKVKGEIKLDLINHYDWIKSELDYLIHKKVAKIEEKNCKQAQSVDYNKLIELCDKIFNINLNQVNEYFNTNKFENFKKADKEKIKEKIFTKYCIFFGSDKFQKNFSNYLIGYIILSNWYIDENLCKFFK